MLLSKVNEVVRNTVAMDPALKDTLLTYCKDIKWMFIPSV